MYRPPPDPSVRRSLHTPLGVPLRRWRALAPPLCSAGSLLLPDLPGEVTLLVALLGLVGGLLTARADKRSRLDGWQRAVPGLSYRGVGPLPDDYRGGPAFLDLARHVGRARAELRRQPRAVRRRLDRDLEKLLREGAELAAQAGRLGGLDHQAAQRRRASLLERLEALPAVVDRLHTTLVRSTTTDLGLPPSLLPLDAAERQLAAEVGADEELEELEVGRWLAATV